MPRVRTALLCSLLVFLAGAPCRADDVGKAQAAVRIGLGGKLKVGNWTPITVEPARPVADGAKLLAVTSDFEGNLVENPLEGASPKSFSGLIQVGRLDGRIAIVERTAAGDTLLAEVVVAPEGTGQAASYRQGTEFWGVFGTKARFGEAATEWTESIRLAHGRNAPAPAVAVDLNWNELPEHIETWDSLDVIAVGADAYSIPSAKSELLRQWVSRGGRLLLILGSATEAYQKSPLATWSPIAVDGVVSVTSMEVVNLRVQGSARLNVARGRNVPVARLPGAPDGTLPGPAVLGKPCGFGFVNAFAFDFEQPPLSTWQSQTALLRQLVLPLGSGQTQAKSEADLGSIGVTDLASQMASGLDRFARVNRLSFRGVMLWTVLWMAVLFPLDYFVVHRLLKRPHLTWITLPALIAAATFLASRSATAGNSAPLTVNQIDLLDYTPADSAARVRSWMSFYSDESARYDVKATSPMAGPARLAWNAKPEEGLRGLYRQGGINFGAASYRTSADHKEIHELPVRQWSSYSLAAEADGSVKSDSPLFESALAETEAGRLEGNLRHHFSAPLREWIVFYKGFAYHPVLQRGELQMGTWPAGAPWRPGLDGQSTLVKNFLQEQRQLLIRSSSKDTTKDQISLEVSVYDPLEFEPSRLIRFLSFHEAAGGANYTGLSNGPLGQLDLSRTVVVAKDKRLDCAVVMGSLEAPIMNYEINGTPVKPGASWTFVRSVLPVDVK